MFANWFLAKSRSAGGARSFDADDDVQVCVDFDFWVRKGRKLARLCAKAFLMHTLKVTVFEAVHNFCELPRNNINIFSNC